MGCELFLQILGLLLKRTAPLGPWLDVLAWLWPACPREAGVFEHSYESWLKTPRTAGFTNPSVGLQTFARPVAHRHA